jgi:carbamoyltransferase
MRNNIIGISALYHDAACCILKEGKLVAAAQEERFSRGKNDPSMPQQAFMFCLEQAGLTLPDVDCVAYYEDPAKKLARQLWSGYAGDSGEMLKKLDPHRPADEIRNLLGYEGPIRYYNHHLSHAASSYYYSGFEHAAILTVDGVGEWATTTYGVGEGAQLRLFEEVHFPDSIGLLYSTLTSYLGFKVNNGEYKVMGLAPYGKPVYKDKIRKLIRTAEGGQFSLDLKYFDFVAGAKMYSPELIALFDLPARVPESAFESIHANIARSLQVVLEEVLLEKVNYLHARTGAENLCMAGGVALNCVANGRLLREGPFKKLFVQPAANDAGCALGAAALAHLELTGQPLPPRRLEHVYLGPSYDSRDISRMLSATSLTYRDYRGNADELIRQTAARLAEGKVIGWFDGRMEFGPRSLGARSILADPRDPQMRDRVNAMVKKREGFRPFAPAVLNERKSEFFALDHDSPFMLEVCQVDSPIALPAITHVDGSARVQTVTGQTNPRFAQLLTEFDRLTGCPILLNTSFNVRSEPIVCTPEDALNCFITTNIDTLVLQDFLIDRSENNLYFLEWIINQQREKNQPAIKQDVYTFI